ncbi:MAG: apolipoprotein N-acyltransferase [Phycisphaeraceae bacterium]
MAKSFAVAPVDPDRPPGVASHFVMLGLSAVLMGVIYPVLGWWWLAYIALVPGALVVSRSASMWRVVWVSTVVFWTWWCVMLWWLSPVTAGGTVAAALVLSVFPTLGWLLIRRLTLQGRLSLTWAVPVAWVLVEFLRTQYPFGGFAWFLLGHSQGPWLPGHSAGVIQIADLFGELTVTAFVALVNGFLADVARQSFSPPKEGVTLEPLRKRFVARVVVVGVVVATVVGYGMTPPMPSLLPDSSTTVVVIQTNEPQNNRQSPSLEDRIADWHALLAETRRSLESRLDEAEAGSPVVVIWPESAVPMPINEETLGLAGAEDWAAILTIEGQVRDLAASYGVDLIIGAPSYEGWERREVDGVERWVPGDGFNSVFHYRADGTRAERRYDKMHRVPFGEYLPGMDLMPWLEDWVVKNLTPYQSSYTIQAGTQTVVFEAGEFAVVTPICFEDTVARVVREMVGVALAQSERPVLLVNVTNDGWFRLESQGYQHLQIAAFRSVENRVPMAKAANTGVSGFISALGEIESVVEVEGESKGVLGHSMRSYRDHSARAGGWTWYSSWGEAPLVVGLLLVGFLGSGVLDRVRRG